MSKGYQTSTPVSRLWKLLFSNLVVENGRLGLHPHLHRSIRGAPVKYRVYLRPERGSRQAWGKNPKRDTATLLSLGMEKLARVPQNESHVLRLSLDGIPGEEVSLQQKQYLPVIGFPMGTGGTERCGKLYRVPHAEHLLPLPKPDEYGDPHHL